jgi:hypothetical protein
MVGICGCHPGPAGAAMASSSVAPPFSSALQVEMARLGQGLESLHSWVQVVR